MDSSSWFAAALMVTSLFAWLTHVVVSISMEAYLLLIVGVLFFPIGIIHGIMIWFGLA